MIYDHEYNLRIVWWSHLLTHLIPRQFYRSSTIFSVIKGRSQSVSQPITTIKCRLVKYICCEFPLQVTLLTSKIIYWIFVNNKQKKIENKINFFASFCWLVGFVFLLLQIIYFFLNSKKFEENNSKKTTHFGSIKKLSFLPHACPPQQKTTYKKLKILLIVFWTLKKSIINDRRLEFYRSQ